MAMGWVSVVSYVVVVEFAGQGGLVYGKMPVASEWHDVFVNFRTAAVADRGRGEEGVGVGRTASSLYVVLDACPRVIAVYVWSST